MDTNLIENINPRYIARVGDEPKQLLQPITGYAYEPLLSLEDACQPLLDIVARLPAYIWVAKQNSKVPDDGLTQDESAAIRLYTMEWDTASDEPRGSLYVHLNQTLKLVDRKKLRPWFRYLKLFLTALAKLPTAPHQTVWRGVRRDYSGDYPPGAEITWWAFSSCTTSLSVLESDLYLGNVGTRTLFSIETINGRLIRSHSHFTTEDEILLLPGTYFEVKSRLNPAPDLFIIHLQQKIPPHVLLEPPYKDAQLFPTLEYHLYKDPEFSEKNDCNRPWYKRRRFLFSTLLAVLFIIFIVLLATLFASRKKSSELLSFTTTSKIFVFIIFIVLFSLLVVSPRYDDNITVFAPVSVGYAFYSFDYNALDLYCRRDGKVIGRSANYTQGYIGTGRALYLNQLVSTWISVVNPFNLSHSSFTIEAFIILLNDSIDANLVQFSSGMSLNIRTGYLEFILDEDYMVSSTLKISTDLWHHVAVVCSAVTGVLSLYIDGVAVRQLGYILSICSGKENITMIIGAGFTGIIDQLSISLEAKSEERILWDATVAAYYPLDADTNAWLLDYGPNCLNATSAGARFVPGQVRGALNFSISGAYYEASGFPVLDIPYHAFSVALWIRSENQSGMVLTIANSMTCLLVLGIRGDDNRIVAYLPNSTNTNTGVNIVGSTMTYRQWTHVAFTWSSKNQAQLYKAAAWQSRNNHAIKLDNGYGEPMTVTLGMYRGNADCTGGDRLNLTKQFSGSLGEFYLFSRELKQDEIEKLNMTTNS